MSKLSDRIIGHYERHALAWDADRQAGSGTDRLWLENFANRLPKDARVLDLGCGSGRPVAAHMAERGFKITGVDSSPTMISLCRDRLPDQSWIVADMRKLALDETFDGILAWDSFFHLDEHDQRRVFEVFDRHAGENALLMFNAGPGPGEAIGTYRGDPLFHASLSPEEYQSLLARHGFEILDHAINDPRAGGRTVWLCGRIPAKLSFASGDDAPAIAQILRKTRQHSLPYLPDLHSPAEDLDFVRDIVLREDTVIVAKAAGVIIGFCAYRNGWVDHLYVLPAHHGKGIGTALLNGAKSANSKLELWTFQRNTHAIAFYCRHGFVLAEMTDGTANEEKEPDARFIWTKG